MKKITQNQWDKIINQAFSPDMPEPEFSQRYQRKKQKILNQADSSTERNVIMNQSRIGFAVTCTACLALAGFAIFGSVTLYQSGRQTISAENQQSSFSPAEAVQITETETESETEHQADDFKISVEQTGDIVNLSIPVEENEIFYEIMFGYVPEGLEYREDGPYALKYHNYEDENDEHAITPDFFRVEDPSKPYTESFDTVYEVEKFQTSSGNPAVFLKKSRGWDMLFVQFEGTPYIESCYLKGFSDEEMHRFANEMYLKQNEREIGGVWRYEPADLQLFNYDVIFQCEENSDSMGNCKLSFGWIPEDLTYQTDNIGDGTWNELCIFGENTEETVNTRKNIAYVLYRVEDISQPFHYLELDIMDVNKITTSSGNDVIYIVHDNSSAIDAIFYVHFKDSPYIAELCTRKISEEDILNVIDALYLTETEEQYYTVYHASEE